MQWCSIEIIGEVNHMAVIFTDIPERRSGINDLYRQSVVDRPTEESVDADEEQRGEHRSVLTSLLPERFWASLCICGVFY